MAATSFFQGSKGSSSIEWQADIPCVTLLRGGQLPLGLVFSLTACPQSVVAQSELMHACGAKDSRGLWQ